MSYAAMMVHLGPDYKWTKRVKLAADLASQFNSALIGIAGWLPVLPFALDDAPVIADQNDAERKKVTALLAEMGEKFKASTKQVGHVEWRGILDYPRTLVPREVRAADLLVVGQETTHGSAYFSLDPGITVLRAGRPVLVVPAQIDAFSAKRVVIAWKDTREARRAVSDALPFLQEAEEVMVVEVCDRGTEAQSQKRVDDVAKYLERHKVVVKIKAYLHTRRSVASELIRYTKDQDADLIVTGGYGHSRLGEWIFGGVTRDLLTDSPVCCLFSH